MIHLQSAAAADGLCAFDILLKPGVISDWASYRDISNAANRVFITCHQAGFEGQQGGYIGGVGMFFPETLNRSATKE